jgi:signal transduction histidine kinase/phage shock protein PspC (stress-responsive transcriptional regulator)
VSMEGGMLRSLRRDSEHKLIGGVCAGLGRSVGLDPLILRVAFAAAAMAGVGIPAYVIAWIVLPEDDGPAPMARLRSGRATVEVAFGVALLVVAALLSMRALGWWFSDAIVWPAALVGAGGALLWRQSFGGSRDADGPRVDAPATALLRPSGDPSHADADATTAQPPSGDAARGSAAVTAPLQPSGHQPAPDDGETAERAGDARLGAAASGIRSLVDVLIGRDGERVPGERAASFSRTGIGIALVLAAGVVFLQATGALSAARDVLLAFVVSVVVLGVILAPWILRLVRSLTTERAERIRSQERAEVAAHLHDSVLQTLAMVQRRSHEPAEVAQLARRQERELRAWLAGRPAPGQAATVGAALEAAAADVEEHHGVPVEVVAVGDRALDGDTEAVVAAAREAMTNAAKFGGGSTVDVYAEAANGRLEVFVRDRGPGFDPTDVPEDRRGVRESIVGRMERHGGRATIRSEPGAGTEVELVLGADR